MPAGEGRLYSEARGEIGKEGDVLVVKRIEVTYHLKADPDNMDAIERVHGFHRKRCPMARTIADCVEVSTSLKVENI